MRHRMLLALLLLPFILPAQTPFFITGTVKDNPLNTVYLLSLYGERTYLVDSVKADASGAFSFTLKSGNKPGMYKIVFGKDRFLEIIFNKENITFSSTISALPDSVKFTSSTENRIYYDFMRWDQQAQAKLELLQPVLDYYPERDAYYRRTMEEFERIQQEESRMVDSLRRDYPGSYAVRLIQTYCLPFIPATLNREERTAFLRQHYFDKTDFTDTSLLRSPAFASKAISYLALYSNNRLQQKQLELEFIKGIGPIMAAAAVNDEVYRFLLDYLISGFDKYHFDDVITYMAENFSDPSSCENTDKESALQKKLETYKKIATGKPAPVLELPDTKGRIVNLANLKSEYTLLIFYSSECTHCAEMLPRVKAMYDTQKPARLEIVAVSLDTDRNAWLNFIKEGKYNWINVSDLKGFESPAADRFNIYATPTMFLLDKDKNILAKPISYSELEQVLREKKLGGTYNEVRNTK
ncbi:MAG TPA: thioredoxin-like domain-containing protein [Bacteroidales bacterium]|nr:thioredoxin-like domain-containing protein [Bacteroidales bacterium]